MLMVPMVAAELDLELSTLVVEKWKSKGNSHLLTSHSITSLSNNYGFASTQNDLSAQPRHFAPGLDHCYLQDTHSDKRSQCKKLFLAEWTKLRLAPATLPQRLSGAIESHSNGQRLQNTSGSTSGHSWQRNHNLQHLHTAKPSEPFIHGRLILQCLCRACLGRH